MVWIVLILAPSITDLQNNSLNTGLKRLLVFKILLLLSQLSALNINNSFMTLQSWLNQHALVILFKYSINLSYLLHLKNKRLFNLSLPCTSSFSFYSFNRPTLHTWSILHSIQFPEKRLVEYDCGKLQVLSTFSILLLSYS